MNLLEKFKEFAVKSKPGLQPSSCRLLVAVSGGIDSVVLTHLLVKSGFSIVIAHCNFQLRAEESDRDEAFVKQFAEHYKLPLLVTRFDTKLFAEENKLSVQEAARKLRYSWFEEMLQREIQSTNNHVHFLVTAHHADDNAETMLMHFFRGTGIQGLTGMPFYNKEKRLVRPLLFAKRQDILDYANQNNLTWVEDSSNASDKYTRNFFRNSLIPSLKEVFPQVEDNLHNNLQRFSEVAVLYEEAIALHKKKLLEFRGNEVHIPLLKLRKLSAVKSVCLEIIKDYGFTVAQADEMMRLFDSDNGSYIQSDTHRIVKNRGWLIISPRQEDLAEHFVIGERDKLLRFRNGELSIKITDVSKVQISADKNIALLNAGEIQFPLILRKWKTGDYFYPLGMQKKKKLSRFFIDQKLSVIDKEKIWVLEMNKKIVWIAGLRIDDRFKILPSTKQVVKFEITFKD